ncbi:class I SAM-dependent methyltransferase [Fusibacter ferrireducens]|uniref:Class I SAM-dependent methyltransferase n=1 Tax=Fusibacter ferrireducens TaxID=2785058 RepID=A0ABR9ZWF3_9FIRM|nr:class I SAM-dependent methyltransferase [Fusibacter ferrireducens]MBF4694686.1 class I SAM-dependent methyltransferase [Fusibacter ferrireducens]
MSNQKVWNFWAPRYKKLWVQKVSLKPTRMKVLDLMEKSFNDKVIGSYIDIGCGVGELIEQIESNFITEHSYGLDYSKTMIEVASKLDLKTKWYCEDVHAFETENRVDLVLCTHSFPYYKDQKYVLSKFRTLLKSDGKLLIAFASKNSFYDALCLAGVKFTTGQAIYPSVSAFIELASEAFNPLSTTRIKAKWYMPSIYLFEMEPKHD